MGRMFIAVLFTAVKQWKWSNCSSRGLLLKVIDSAFRYGMMCVNQRRPSKCICVSVER